MPIYEFYCSDCHAIFNFFSRTVSVKKSPICPRCKKKELERQISMFAMTGGDKTENELGDLPIDESKMEQAITALAGEAEKINEDDPRQAARLMRKFSGMTGLEFGDSMESALDRMEAGEDPAKIEAEMGDIMENEEPFILPGSRGKKSSESKRKRRKLFRDEQLYEL
ncbi:zinc ribbon domain-containing protein [Verrucomicrobiota bacterium]